MWKFQQPLLVTNNNNKEQFIKRKTLAGRFHLKALEQVKKSLDQTKSKKK